MSVTISLLLVGLGNLGRRFCDLLVQKDAWLCRRYGLALRLVGAADSRGAAYDSQDGLDPALLAALKRSGGSVADYPVVGQAGWSALSLVEIAEADVLLDASPVHLAQGGEPGLSCIRAALGRRIHVVTPNKGPLVLAYQELHALAAAQGVALRFDGAVAGGLPALYIGQRDLRGAVVERLEAVPNLVTGYVVDQLADGVSWDEALATARQEGVLEADPAWDLDGWDAAAKLVILANAVLEQPSRLEDVSRVGIGGLSVDELRAARARGCRYRLLAAAHRTPGGEYQLSVAPTPLPEDHPLGRLGAKQMGVLFETDIYGTITALIEEPDPMPSAATMLRDVLDIAMGAG
ncbi:MAG: homoserine dehydrogenase [Chloroflexi bacterium]|nr:homoserine dehydrogenase [Chloroflexota bacterium]